MPEGHKTAKKAKARRRQAQHRLRRRRITVDIGAEILLHWQPVFAQAAQEPSVQELFRDHVMPQTQLADWGWGRWAWRADLEGLHDTIPGPDGLPYTFWRTAPPERTSIVNDVGERMA